MTSRVASLGRHTRRHMRLGLVIGRDTLTAVEIRSTLRGWRPGRSWSLTLATALAELRAALGSGRVTASVALRRPLAQVKVVAVPPLRRRALRTLLQRNARRYFVTGPDAVVVDAIPVGAAPGAEGGFAAAAFAPAALLESTIAEIEAAGFEVDRATAAAIALREAVMVLARDAFLGRLALAACSPEEADVVLLERGVPRLVVPVSRTPQTSPEEVGSRVAEVVRSMGAAGAAPERVMVLGDAGARAAVLERLASTPEGGLPVQPVPPALRDRSPDTLTALGAALVGERSALLLSDALRARRQRAAHRRTALVVACAAALFGAAAALHLLDLERELRAVEAQRRAIAPAVARVSASRRASDDVRSALGTIARLERTAPRWTDALGALATSLPDSAYVVSFAAAGGEVRIGGVAVSGDEVVPSLEAAPLFSHVALAAPLRRDDANGLEHFELTAALAGATPAAGEVEARPR